MICARPTVGDRRRLFAKYSAGRMAVRLNVTFCVLLAQLWLTRLKIGSQNRTPSLPKSDNPDTRTRHDPKSVR
jgi:hypothetical protein